MRPDQKAKMWLFQMAGHPFWKSSFSPLDWSFVGSFSYKKNSQSCCQNFSQQPAARGVVCSKVLQRAENNNTMAVPSLSKKVPMTRTKCLPKSKLVRLNMESSFKIWHQFVRTMQCQQHALASDDTVVSILQFAINCRIANSTFINWMYQFVSSSYQFAINVCFCILRNYACFLYLILCVFVLHV